MARVEPFECTCPACTGIDRAPGAEVVSREVVIEQAAYLCRWAHSITRLHELDEKDQQETLERIAKMAGLLHSIILASYPETERVLPKGGIHALIHA